jgi:hypothetical protein
VGAVGGGGGAVGVGNTNISNTNVVRGGAYAGGYYGGGYPVGAAAVTTAAVAGTAALAYSASNPGYAVAGLPCSASPYGWNGVSYYQCGSTWYTRSYVDGNVAYVVTGPPG